MIPELDTVLITRYPFLSSYHVRDILFKHGLSVYWDTQYVPSREAFCRKARDAIYNRSITGLKQTAATSSKGVLYRELCKEAPSIVVLHGT